MPNLILVHQKSKQDRAEYEEIGRRVGVRAPDVAVFIVDTKQAGWFEPRFDAAAPTLTVSPMPIKRFAPPRGAVCQGFEFPKGEQYERLAALGHQITVRDAYSGGFALIQALRIDPVSGLYFGGSDPRTHGAAKGY